VTELVIGSRRPRRQRRLRGLGIAAGLGLLAVVVCYFIYSRVVRYPEPTGEMPAGAVAAGPLSDGASEWALFWGGECSLAHAGQLAVLRAVGKPHTLGACHGRLLAGAVIDSTAPLSAAIRAAVPDDGILGGARRGSRLRWRLRLLDDGIPPARLEEIEWSAPAAGRCRSTSWCERTRRSMSALRPVMDRESITARWRGRSRS
jgi:hypothetical protein